jgi:hypothetical protein
LLLQQAVDGSAVWLEMTMTATPKMSLAVRFGQPIKRRPSCWLARLGPTVVFALLFGFTEARAQAPSVPVSGVDAALIEDIVTGSRVLADFGVLDGFGQSARVIRPIPITFSCRGRSRRRSSPPTTSWSSISMETPWATVVDPCFWSASFIAKFTRRGRT